LACKKLNTEVRAAEVSAAGLEVLRWSAPGFRPQGMCRIWLPNWVPLRVEVSGAMQR